MSGENFISLTKGKWEQWKPKVIKPSLSFILSLKLDSVWKLHRHSHSPFSLFLITFIFFFPFFSLFMFSKNLLITNLISFNLITLSSDKCCFCSWYFSFISSFCELTKIPLTDSSLSNVWVRGREMYFLQFRDYFWFLGWEIMFLILSHVFYHIQ